MSRLIQIFLMMLFFIGSAYSEDLSPQELMVYKACYNKAQEAASMGQPAVQYEQSICCEEEVLDPKDIAACKAYQN